MWKLDFFLEFTTRVIPLITFKPDLNKLDLINRVSVERLDSWLPWHRHQGNPGRHRK
ncbi:unnamed protein product, partial [Allacma fusca]